MSNYQVVQESRSCIANVNNEHQYLSSSTSLADGSSLSNCGSKSHPWRLEAPVGQRINISLLDFSWSHSTHSGDVTSCRQYGYIEEKSDKSNVSICAATSLGGAISPREIAVYTTQTNKVEMVLNSGTNSNSLNFLIKVNGETLCN